MTKPCNYLIIVAFMFMIGCSCEREGLGSGDRIGQRSANLSREEKRRRREQDAVTKKIRALNDADTKGLIAATSDRHYKVRVMAVRAINERKLKSQKVIDAIVPLTVDKEGEVRRTTIRTLSEIGEPAIPSLIKGLRSDHPLAEKYFTLEGTSRRFYVWDSSKRVLGKIGEKAIPALTEALKSDDAMQRVKAAASLEIVGEPAAASSVSILIDGMKDEEWQVRRTFLRCLSTIAPNDPAVKSLITKTANDDQDERVRRAADDVLKKMKEGSASKEGV